jgi:hypothetical protein
MISSLQQHLRLSRLEGRSPRPDKGAEGMVKQAFKVLVMSGILAVIHHVNAHSTGSRARRGRRRASGQ